MNCLEFRQLKLSDPYTDHVEANGHRDECEACTAFEAEIGQLDANLHAALAVKIPDGLAARILLNQSLQKPERKPSTRWMQLGLAASLFIAVALGFYQVNREPDVSPFLAHATHQPHEFYGSEHTPISNAEVEQVLAAYEVQANLENVVYAAICPLNGENAAHLVIRDGVDQYTVMLLPDQSPRRRFTVDDGTWRGYISPHPAGALAVLADTSDKSAVSHLKEVSDKVQNALYYTAEL